uniref:Protein kinase domain-containing protein n=1 Tax=Grammatophora oceanica TaxID=210454 RepID=A0A7S1UXR2_9STRA
MKKIDPLGKGPLTKEGSSRSAQMDLASQASGSSSLTENACKKAALYASKGSQKLVSRSQFMTPEREGKLPRFDEGEIGVGRLLREGKFVNWFELSDIRMRSDAVESLSSWSDEHQQQTIKRATLSDDCVSEKYAIKCFSKKALRSARSYTDAASRLTAETIFLVNMSHPHLLRIEALSEAGIKGFLKGTQHCFFTVVDKIEMTLEDKLEEWAAEDAALSNRFGGAPGSLTVEDSHPDNKVRRDFLLRRLRVARDLASALSYVHELNVLHRNLRPTTIGFAAVDGKVKIIDFGVAKELDATKNFRKDSSNPKLCPSERIYFAPEVACREIVGLSADVYNLAVIFWRICSLDLSTPFKELTPGDYFDSCVYGDQRPPIDSSWPVSSILVWMWRRNPMIRPSMKDVFKTLVHECGVEDAGQTIIGSSGERRASPIISSEALPLPGRRRYSQRRRASLNRLNTGAQAAALAAVKALAEAGETTTSDDDAPTVSPPIDTIYMRGPRSRASRRTSI